jgi:hypothetical protein
MAEGEMRQEMTEEGRVFLHTRDTHFTNRIPVLIFPPTHTVLD